MDTNIYLIYKGPSISLNNTILEEPSTCKKENFSFMKTFGCEIVFNSDKIEHSLRHEAYIY